MITAQEYFLQETGWSDMLSIQENEKPEDIIEMLIGFGQLCADEALKEAAKKAEVHIKFNDRDNSVLITDEHGLRDQDGIWCEISVHTQTINMSQRCRHKNS